MDWTEDLDLQGLPSNVGAIALKRKQGKLFLQAKSPLIHGVMEGLSGGNTATDPYFGVDIFLWKPPSDVSEKFYNSFGVTFSPAARALFGHEPKLWFNLGFLRAVGLRDGVQIPLKEAFPLTLLESGAFSSAVRNGVSEFLKEFGGDFNFKLKFTSEFSK